MAVALTRENYVLHKLHSLTGIVPTGFYLLQHLTLNSFSLAGPQRFNDVIHFFETVPKHVLLAAEVLLLWIPILFHAVYGMFIVGRAKSNSLGGQYTFAENRMYSFQRWTGVVLFFFIFYHVASTTGIKYAQNSPEAIEYAAMSASFTANGYALLIVYAVGVLSASYHLAYGIWNFCIRWGITVSDQAQQTIRRAAAAIFIVVTLLGWSALAGFLIHQPR